MPGMHLTSLALLRPLFLFFAVSLVLGPLQCTAAEMDNAGSMPVCCVRGDVVGDEDDALSEGASDVGSSSCPVVCPGTAVLAESFLSIGIASPARTILSSPPFVGRPFAPDPRPPKYHSIV